MSIKEGEKIKINIANIKHREKNEIVGQDLFNGTSTSTSKGFLPPPPGDRRIAAKFGGGSLLAPPPSIPNSRTKPITSTSGII